MRHSLPQYVRAHMHRRLFAWFGASIFLTVAVLLGVSHLVDRLAPSPWHTEMQRATRFAGGRFAAVWADPPARRALAAAAARELDLDLNVVDAEGHKLESFGDCATPQLRVPVQPAATAESSPAAVLGHIEVCAGRHYSGGLWRLALPLLLAGAVLWGASGKLSRRLTRPLVDLARVARDIGNGKLQSRARLRGREPGEVGILAESINDMAAKLERQMAEQRELLAAVSHELRTPLTRMRVLIELAATGEPAKHLAELDREIAEMDALVGDLLASARLDFSALRLRSLTAGPVATRALERAGLPAALLQDDSGGAEFSADPTLLARALANLLDNAKKHGGGARALRVKTRPGRLAFEVEDSGRGFSDEAVRRVFQPFSASSDGEGGSLGLGLALVRRIAEAHGGSAYAQNREGGGAAVGFEVRC